MPIRKIITWGLRDKYRGTRITTTERPDEWIRHQWLIESKTTRHYGEDGTLTKTIVRHIEQRLYWEQEEYDGCCCR